MDWTVVGVPYHSDPTPRIGADESGLMHTNPLVNATAWGAEIEMLRVLRAVADLIGAELHEVARAHRELSLLEVAQSRGVAREVLLDAVMIALRAGEPIAGLWHQRAELRERAEQLVTRKPRRARREQQQNGHRRGARDPERRVDDDGHLDTMA